MPHRIPLIIEPQTHSVSNKGIRHNPPSHLFSIISYSVYFHRVFIPHLVRSLGVSIVQAVRNTNFPEGDLVHAIMEETDFGRVGIP
jgi:hypothetical protein